MARESAMTPEDVLAGISVGIDQGLRAAAAGAEMIGLGEMGIGNSTAASAITAALTGLPPAAVTGRGTGADDAMLRRKVAVIEDALRQRQPDPRDGLDDASLAAIPDADLITISSKATELLALGESRTKN